MIVQEPIQVSYKLIFSELSKYFRRDVSTHFKFPQVIIWDCLNNYEYDNAIFLAERLHAEGKHNIHLLTNI